jgi:hypothetical protein
VHGHAPAHLAAARELVRQARPTRALAQRLHDAVHCWLEKKKTKKKKEFENISRPETLPAPIMSSGDTPMEPTDPKSAEKPKKQRKRKAEPDKPRKVPRVVLQRMLNAARAFHSVSNLKETPLAPSYPDETAARSALMDATLYEAHRAFAEPVAPTERDPTLHALDLSRDRPGIVADRSVGGVAVFSSQELEPENNKDEAKPPRAVKRKGCMQAVTSAGRLEEKRAEQAEERRTRPKVPRKPRAKKDPAEPTEPTDPADPIDPAEPTEPADPTGPSKQPSQSKPRQPTDNAFEADDADSGDTGEADYPGDAAHPQTLDSAEGSAVDQQKPGKRPEKKPEKKPKKRKATAAEELVVLDAVQFATEHDLYESPGRWVQQLRVLEDMGPLYGPLAAAITRGEATGAVELVVGPPGTGKSVELLRRVAEAAGSGDRILVTAPTNLAVADLFKRFRTKAVTAAHLVMRAERVPVELSPADAAQRVDPEASGEACVVFATAATVTLACMRRTKPFAQVFVDEAGLLPEAACWCLVHPATTRLVLCGDPAQLEGMVSEEGRALQFGRSLFRRLLDLGHPATQLDVQRRMHPQIAALSIDRFYAGRVRTDYTEPLGVEKPLLGARLARVAGKATPSGTSFENHEEAAAAVGIAQDLRAAFGDDHTVALLCPYAAQAALCKKLAPGVEVATVDSFQGREASAVVLCMVREGRHGFWSADERMCVAMTRARHHLTIVAGPGWTDADLGVA